MTNGAVAAAPPTMFVHALPLYTWISPDVPQLLHQTTKPAAGLGMSLRWASVIRGGRKPLVVELTSSCAEGLMFAGDTPMPTWALVARENSNMAVSNALLILFIGLFFMFDL
jgi:hypothetical protein